MSLDASVLKNLCLWCKFQSRLLFIIRLLLKNFLTALLTALIRQIVKIDVCSLTPPYQPNQKLHLWVNTSESWGLQASNVPLSPPPLFIYLFIFCSCFNFRTLTQAETLAAQARQYFTRAPCLLFRQPINFTYSSSLLHLLYEC